MASNDLPQAQTTGERIRSLAPWFQNVHLPDGTETAPGHRFGDFPAFKWRRVRDAIPQDLQGWTALDVGCNAGYYSVELAKRGAEVMAVDVEPLYVEQARWVIAQFGFESRIHVRQGDVYELARTTRMYDLVWFTGVFYHLRYPLLALDLVRRVTRRRLVFQTMTMPGDEVIDAPANVPLDAREALSRPGWPKIAFIEHKVDDDPTNWWAPNQAGVEALLRSAGFRVLARPEHEFYLCEPVPGARRELDELLRSIAR